MNTAHIDQAVNKFDVDTAHSTVEFKVRHLGFSKVRGRFMKFDAHFEFVPDDLSTLEAEVVIDASSVDTGDAKRDEHLRSEDFFNVAEHPEIRFRSNGVSDVSGKTVTMKGDLTIRGITHPVELKGKYLGEAQDPWGGSRVAFEGSTKVNRKDYGLKWNQVLETGGMLVGDTVEIDIDIQGVLHQEDA